MRVKRTVVFVVLQRPLKIMANITRRESLAEQALEFQRHRGKEHATYFVGPEMNASL